MGNPGFAFDKRPPHPGKQIEAQELVANWDCVVHLWSVTLIQRPNRVWFSREVARPNEAEGTSEPDQQDKESSQAIGQLGNRPESFPNLI